MIVASSSTSRPYAQRASRSIRPQLLHYDCTRVCITPRSGRDSDKIHCMMTVHKLSAGDGYTYYIRETASADAQRERGQELGDYYATSGNPPGVWMGSGIDVLGVSGTVSEAQMKALYGEGLHPDAERIIAERIAAGASAKQAVRAAKLGRSYMQFTQKDTPFGRKLHEELETFARLHMREPDAEERADIRGKVGAVHFRAEHGRGPESKEELGRFIKDQEGGKQRNAVAGYDLVFRAPKSVSVLWGLGDESVRQLVEQAHVQALTETLHWLEQHAAMTRTGVSGIAQEDISGGLIATRFRHYDSRTGDPLLHDHVVVSNKVMGRDGKWRALDGQLLFMQGVAASELYNQRVVEAVCENLGLRAEAREVTPGKRPVMEIAGVGTDLIEAHSSRSQSIKERTAELVADYRDRHGYDPSSKALTALMQQATLDTRPDKAAAQPLSELRRQWRAAAVETFGSDRVDGLLRDARAAAQRALPGPEAVPHIDVHQAAREVLETVSDHRSVWGRRQVLAEARRWVMQATTGAAPGGDLANRITDRVLAAEAIDITPPDLNPRFAPLTRDDGTSIYRRRETELYTSSAVLAAEDRIVAAARTRVIPAVSEEVYRRVEAAYQQAHADRRLDAGQRELARTFATSELLVAAAIGPAGAGKTTAMRVAADAVRESGGRVIGLGPSARAASELSAGLNAPAFVLHEWLGARGRARAGKRIRPEFELHAGDVIIVDEAGMAGSKRLASVVAEAEAAGAVVRLIGDPFQLAAVESGGALRLLANTTDVVELESVHRFRAPGEAAASLLLRSGEPDEAWAWYLDNHRVVAGTREQMVHQIFADWQSDIEQGLTALMMADDNATVAELNALAQAYRMGSGQLDATQTVDLHDGVEAHRGDLIVTRRNDRQNLLRSGRDFVKNGDQWQITEVRDNGDLVVRHTDHGGRTVLPADYASNYVELGYASTGHRGQGATVDTGSGLVTRRTSRESAYVEMTRGRQKNRLYVVLDEGQTMRDVLDAVAHNTQASVSATEAIRAEQDRAWGIGQLAAEYTDVHARAQSLRYQRMARAVLGNSADAVIAEDAWPAVERALRDAERAGFAPERILTTAFHEREFSGAEDDAAVLSWRIDNHVADAQEVMRRLAEQGTTRPLQDLTDEQLGRLAERAEERRHQALEVLHQADARVANQPRPVVVNGLPVPAWPGRVHGDLTRIQLSQAIAQARRDGRIAMLSEVRAIRDSRVTDAEAYRAEAREAAARLVALKGEQQLRSEMTWRDRTREEWQREPGHGNAHTAGMDGDSVAAMMRANLYGQDEARVRMERAALVDQRVRAEQRLRHLLPDTEELVPDHTGPVPEWLAPREAERDQYTPEAWLEHLAARREVLDERLAQTGRALAADPPAWAQGLGPVPPEGGELRALWERTAALADAWRTRHQTRSGVPGIGGQPVGGRDAQAWQELQDRVAEVGRRARAVDAAARRGEALAADGKLVPRAAADDRTQTAAAPEAALTAVDTDAHTADPEPAESVLARGNEDGATLAADEASASEEALRQTEEDSSSAQAQREAERRVEEDALRTEDEERARQLAAERDSAAEDSEDQEAVTRDASQTEDEAAEVPAQETSGSVAWDRRPYGALPDEDLATALSRAVEAAAAAQEQVAAAEQRAAELAAAILPGGPVEQRVDQRAERVAAILGQDALTERIGALNGQIEQTEAEAAQIEARLGETTRLGRQAIRGDERRALEARLGELQGTGAQLTEQLANVSRERMLMAQVAGVMTEHEAVLEAWREAGGSREAVLERAVASRREDAHQATAEAAAARGRVSRLDSAAAAIRQELNARAAQPAAQQAAEQAARQQAAVQQQQALEQQRQQGAQQDGPEQGPRRSGPKA
ncbi:MobF family relaxase [Streptomyces syringium]|uniref:MobF family relaxase n=1 Tax=Streptomyces syringium TaxID=76729 RepID=UPI0037D5AB25